MGNKPSKQDNNIAYYPATNKNQTQPKIKSTAKPTINAAYSTLNNQFLALSSNIGNTDKNSERKNELSRLIVYGYIHSSHLQLIVNIIPDDIVNLIAFNYTYKYPLNPKFNRKHCSKCLRIQSKDKTKWIKKYTNYGYGTFLFGTPITHSVCNQYSITIKFHSMSGEFMMGYVTSLNAIDCNETIGRSKNKTHSVGINVLMHEYSLDIYDTNRHSKSNTNCYEYNDTFNNKSSFTLLFDFRKDSLTVYHDKEKGQTISLHGRKIMVPAFTLFDQDVIEIVSWKKSLSQNGISFHQQW